MGSFGAIYQQFLNHQGQDDVMRADRHVESVSKNLSKFWML